MSDTPTAAVGLPPGLNPLRGRDRRRVLLVYGGDVITFDERIFLHDGTPATPENSLVCFALVDQRFSTGALWAGVWGDGVVQINPADHPNLVRITVPDTVSASLRRGGYLYSMVVTGLNGETPKTQFEGDVLVQYAPTGPHRNIPYRSDSDDI